MYYDDEKEGLKFYTDPVISGLRMRMEIIEKKTTDVS